MQLEGRSVPEGTTIEADVCIAGAGAAGITLALTLARAGVDVCLVESGGLSPDIETQELHRGESVGHPYFPLDSCRLRLFGGTTNHWTGWCRPLDPIDLEAKEWAPRTGWPLSRSELDPYYARAQELCQLGPFQYSGSYWAGPHGRTLFPVDPATFGSTVLQLSPPVRFGVVYRDELLTSPHARVLLQTNVVEVVPQRDGRRIERLDAATLAGNRFTLRARVYVLATGGIENARLLLASRSRLPGGVGNAHDWVGRTFMEHPHLVSGFFLPADPSLNCGFYRLHTVRYQRLTGALALANRRMREEGLLNASLTLNHAPRIPAPYLEAELSAAFESFRALGRGLQRGEVPDDLSRHLWNVLCDLDDVARASYARLAEPREQGWMYKLFLRTEQLPDPDSRVTLSDELDPFGQPRARLDWRIGELDLRTLRRTQELFALEMGRTGLGRVLLPPADDDAWTEAIFGGNHHMGTTRMHVDPRRGVVDSDCRVHGIENLYIGGSSVFPSCGFSNPTLTIVALATRLGDRLSEVVSDPA